MQKPDIVFLTETSAGYDAIPTIGGYEKFADKEIRELNHGGIVCYVRSALAPHVFNIIFNESYVSFRLNFIPTFVFIGCYIQPENSKYFDPDMFGELGALLMTLQERKLNPIMGGDLNCRFGNLNQLREERGLLYGENSDMSSNKHGLTYGKDLCRVGDVFPLNHLVYRGKTFDGDFTYFKASKKSQIDFAYTNKNGLKLVETFAILKDYWHLSDHRPILVKIQAARMFNSGFLLKRAKELNFEFDPNRPTIVRHLGDYDLDVLSNYLRSNEVVVQSDVLSEMSKCNINNAVIKLDTHLHDALRVAKKKKTITTNNVPKLAMEKANEEFDNYQKSLRGESVDSVEEAWKKYQLSRKSVTSSMHDVEHNKWTSFIESKNAKDLWESIDWKGNLSRSQTVRPTDDELALHFEKLYSTDDPEESSKIEELTTDTYIPALDDPISMEEVDTAAKEMKKGGYDYNLDILKVLVQVMSPLLLLFFNVMFYVAYPVSLARSLLSALPKKGNLSLPANFRGIQMLTALSALYDRIIAIRLRKWSGLNSVVNFLQSAFQKGKSTIHQIFTLRIIIELAKQTNTTIYIGFFDLAKAFDKVSRVLLLRNLIEQGIGNCMLQALKRIYLHTSCIIGNASQASDEFRTTSGIRQGAASSVLLFIFFMDGLISFLQVNCIQEPILNIIHCLLHADDTIVISTDRETFVRKCNLMLQYFDENRLSLNFSKSKYMIINPKENDLKCDIQLSTGKFEYCQEYVYLGAVITDTGSVTYDIERYVALKRANVSIKFNNFLRKNFLAPLSIKLNVLDVCVVSSLTYACESWGSASINSIEVVYRLGLKRALSVRETVNTEIIYIEADRLPLNIRIAKQQLKFWISLQSYLEANPDHPLKGLLDQGLASNLPYLKYYTDLQTTYTSPKNLEEVLTNEFRASNERKINTKSNNDAESRLGVYLQVNRNLIPPPQRHDILECERVLLTRYRCGSHNLKIEVGRLCNPKIPREERLCKCNAGVQSLRHCLFDCQLLQEVYREYEYTTIEEAFNSPEIVPLLAKIGKVLGIP